METNHTSIVVDFLGNAFSGFNVTNRALLSKSSLGYGVTQTDDAPARKTRKLIVHTLRVVMRGTGM